MSNELENAKYTSKGMIPPRNPFANISKEQLDRVQSQMGIGAAQAEMVPVMDEEPILVRTFLTSRGYVYTAYQSESDALAAARTAMGNPNVLQVGVFGIINRWSREWKKDQVE